MGGRTVPPVHGSGFTQRRSRTRSSSRASPRKGPRSGAGWRPGDRILAVRDDPVASLAGLWRKVWAGGSAGSEVVLQVARDNETLTVRVLSADRTRFYKTPKLH